MKDFTAEELAEFDGQNGKAAYVAYQGKVYDVSESAMWVDGDHEAMHMAGSDLTEAHEDAPHDVYITDFTEIGRLI